MCGVKLNERKKSEELRELLGLESVSLMIKKSRFRWFGHVERKDDNDIPTSNWGGVDLTGAICLC